MSNAYTQFSPRRPSPLPLVFAGAAFALAAYVALDRFGLFDPAPRVAPRAVTARGEPAPVVVAPWTALAMRVPSRALVRERSVSLDVGMEIDRDELVGRLLDAGYARMPMVEERGEIAVRGVPDERWGEVGCAHVVLAEGHALEAEQFTAWGRERLARFKIPQELRIETELPRTASGKVQKHLLG